MEPLENFFHLGLVLRQVALGEDHDVVDVDNDHVFHVSENLIHHGLEGGGGVAESEEHDGWFEGSTMTYERGLPFVSFFDADVVVVTFSFLLAPQLPSSLPRHSSVTLVAPH